MSLLIRGPKNKYASRELLEHVVANFDLLPRAMLAFEETRHAIATTVVIESLTFDKK